MPKSIWPVKGRGRVPIIPANRLIRQPNRGRINMQGLNGLGEDVVYAHTELENGPSSLPYHSVPVDMYPRYVENWQRNPDGSISEAGGTGDPVSDLLSRIARDTNQIASTVVLRRGLLGRTVSVTTTPQLVINAEYLRGYIILNPNEVAGATSAGTLLSSAARTGSGTSAALGVANFLNAHYFLDLTAITAGTLDIDLQVLDPVSGNWATVQNIFSTGTAPSTLYAEVGTLGTPTDVRVAWSVSGGGTATFSVGFVLKNGLVGTSAGTLQTIFLGGPGVTVESGFPLLNGVDKTFFLEENLQLYAVANATLPLKIFEL